jgi:hypothetical protein
LLGFLQPIVTGTISFFSALETSKGGEAFDVGRYRFARYERIRLADEQAEDISTVMTSILDLLEHWVAVQPQEVLIEFRR